MPGKPISIITITWLTLSVLSLFLSVACSQGNDEPAGPSADSTDIKLYNADIERVVAIGRVEPEEKIIDLYPEAAGRLLAVNVELGDTVQRDELLFEIDHLRQDAQIARTEALIREQESTIPGIEAKLVKARLQAANAERSFRRIQTVFEGGAETKQSLDDAEAAWKTAIQDVTALEADLANTRTSLEVLRADLRLARLDRDDRFLRAPADGVLFSVDVAAGFRVDTGTRLGQLAPASPKTILTEVDELFADRVQAGQRAFVRRQGAVDTIASGYVIEVAPSLSQKSLFSDAVGTLEDRRVRAVRVRIEDGGDKLLYGARVECVVKTVMDRD